MPCIVIKTKKSDEIINLKLLTEDLSRLTKIDIKRISIMVDYYDESAFLKSDDNLIIFVYISENNPKAEIDLLCSTIASLSERYFHKKKNSTGVICNPIRCGYFYLNGIIK